MDKFIIDGNTTLKGEVKISGAKNSALALLPATLLVNGITTLENVPNISDVRIICEIMSELGVKVSNPRKNVVEIDAREISKVNAPMDLTSKFRASYYLIGSLLGRCHNVSVGLPGGCMLGARPIDQHIKGFEKLGAKVRIARGKVTAKAKELVGTQIYFDVVSVGATINLILASVLADGVTTLNNVAKEPHVVDVADFLNSVGAKIEGAGTDEITITGVKELKGNHTYSVVPDQIETGTFMLAAVASHGDILIKNCVPSHLDPLTLKLIDMGAEVDVKKTSIHVKCPGRIGPANVTTLPYPGFPTDLQPQMGVTLCVAVGTSIITESIWDARFQYTDELIKMGAQITASGQTAVFEGVEKLTAAPLYASDLRAGAALIIAAIIADGTSELHNVHYIDRGYENVIEKFQALGAHIERVPDDEAELIL